MKKTNESAVSETNSDEISAARKNERRVWQAALFSLAAWVITLVLSGTMLLFYPRAAEKNGVDESVSSVTESGDHAQ